LKKTKLGGKRISASAPKKIDVEDRNRLDFTIMCNGKRFVVTIYSTTSLEDQITPLVSLYNKAFQKEDDENLEKVQDEIEDIIYKSGWRKFSLLVPANESGSLAPISLHSALNPDIFYFRLVTGRGYAHIIQEHTPSWSHFPVYLTINATSNLPRYSTREIQFTKKLMGIGYIAKVFVNRQDICCKMVTTHTKAVQREYECLSKIAGSQYPSSISAPKLIGFVMDDSNTGTIGILEEYIPHNSTLGRPYGGIEAITHERKRGWAEQISHNVRLLHKIGVVWGDAKPENVLINSDMDDCWLVDFGGSWTDGWVNARLMKTKAGNEQALARIYNFLGV